MNTVSLQSIILIDEGNKTEVLDHVDMIEKRLKQNAEDTYRIFCHHEMLMANFLQFTVDGINWNIGIQIQEALESLDTPVLFIGSSGSGLTDISALKKGKFDSYLTTILTDPDELQEFLTFFLPTTSIIDYSLKIWSRIIGSIEDEMLLEQLTLLIDYSPLKSLITEQQDRVIDRLESQVNDESKFSEEEIDPGNDERQESTNSKKNKKMQNINDKKIMKLAEENHEKGKITDAEDKKKEEISLVFAHEIDEEEIRKSQVNRKRRRNKRPPSRVKKSKNSKNSEVKIKKNEKKVEENEEENPQQSLDDFF